MDRGLISTSPAAGVRLAKREQIEDDWTWLERAAAALRRLWGRAGEPKTGLVFPGQKGERRALGYDGGWADKRQRRRERGKPTGEVVTTPGHKELAGIVRRVRFHDLRHTCASHLIQGTWGRVWALEEEAAQLAAGAEALRPARPLIGPGANCPDPDCALTDRPLPHDHGEPEEEPHLPEVPPLPAAAPARCGHPQGSLRCKGEPGHLGTPHQSSGYVWCCLLGVATDAIDPDHAPGCPLGQRLAPDRAEAAAAGDSEVAQLRARVAELEAIQEAGLLGYPQGERAALDRVARWLDLQLPEDTEDAELAIEARIEELRTPYDSLFEAAQTRIDKAEAEAEEERGLRAEAARRVHDLARQVQAGDVALREALGELATAQARIVELETQRPAPPRPTTAGEFRARGTDAPQVVRDALNAAVDAFAEAPDEEGPHLGDQVLWRKRRAVVVSLEPFMIWIRPRPEAKAGSEAQAGYYYYDAGPDDVSPDPRAESPAAAIQAAIEAFAERGQGAGHQVALRAELRRRQGQPAAKVVGQQELPAVACQRWAGWQLGDRAVPRGGRAGTVIGFRADGQIALLRPPLKKGRRPEVELIAQGVDLVQAEEQDRPAAIREVLAAGRLVAEYRAGLVAALGQGQEMDAPAVESFTGAGQRRRS